MDEETAAAATARCVGVEVGLRLGVRVGEAPKSAAGIDRSLHVCCIHTDIRLEVFLARIIVGVAEDFSPPVDGDGDERLFMLLVIIVGKAEACCERCSPW